MRLRRILLLAFIIGWRSVDSFIGARDELPLSDYNVKFLLSLALLTPFSYFFYSCFCCSRWTEKISLLECHYQKFVQALVLINLCTGILFVLEWKSKVLTILSSVHWSHSVLISNFTFRLNNGSLNEWKEIRGLAPGQHSQSIVARNPIPHMTYSHSPLADCLDSFLLDKSPTKHWSTFTHMPQSQSL